MAGEGVALQLQGAIRGSGKPRSGPGGQRAHRRCYWAAGVLGPGAGLFDAVGSGAERSVAASSMMAFMVVMAVSSCSDGLGSVLMVLGASSDRALTRLPAAAAGCGAAGFCLLVVRVFVGVGNVSVVVKLPGAGQAPGAGFCRPRGKRSSPKRCGCRWRRRSGSRRRAVPHQFGNGRGVFVGSEGAGDDCPGGWMANAQSWWSDSRLVGMDGLGAPAGICRPAPGGWLGQAGKNSAAHGGANPGRALRPSGRCAEPCAERRAGGTGGEGEDNAAAGGWLQQ